MRTKNENIFLVGNLQVFALPFVSLYIDLEKRSLCLFVRISKPQKSVQYVVTDVSSREVQRYMAGECDLSSLLDKKSYQLADIVNKSVYLQPYENFVLTKEIIKANEFDSRFCVDKTKLKFFLKRYDNH